MKFKLKLVLLSVIVSLVLGAIISYFIYPDASADYHGFWKGLYAMIHGSCFIPNIVFAQFDETREVIASNSGGWYLTVWWISAIVSLYSMLIRPVYRKIN